MATLPTLPAIIEQHARSASASDVFLEQVDGRVQTYAEAHHRAQSIARSMAGFGVGEDDRVLIFLPLSIDVIDMWTGLGWIGAAAVPVNLDFRGPTLSYVLRDARAEVIVCDRARLEHITALADLPDSLRRVVVLDDPGIEEHELGSLRVSGWDAFRSSANEALPLVRPGIHSPAAIMYTSGTTGEPKGAVLPWGAFSRSGENIRTVGGWVATDALYLPFPPNHVSSTQWLTGMAQAGGRVVLRPGGFRTSDYWSDVRRTGCTVTLLVGAMAAFLQAQAPAPDDADNPLRRACVIPAIADMAGFETRFGLSGYTLYGSTEVGTVIAAVDMDDAGGGCGSLMPGFEARLVDEHDQSVPPGQPGELLLRPTDPWTTFSGYYGKPDATAHACRNMWFHTGDAFRLGASGRYVFVDRIKDVIRRRGENISSAEVESYVLAHHAVLECAAVPVPAADSEDEVKVFVALRAGTVLTAEELLGFVQESNMPSYMLPLYVEFVDELPKTPTNKVRKAELKGRGVTSATWQRPLVRS